MKLPRLTAREVIRVLEKVGFVLQRTSGAHFIYKNAAGRRTVVAFHAGKTLRPKTLKGIIAGAGLTIEEFVRLLKA